ncbi:MAG: LLM class flavin-dependent oxidoreductase [Anaerolineales bacterium]
MAGLKFGVIAELVARGGVSSASLLEDNCRTIDLLLGQFESVWFDDHFQKDKDPVFESWTSLTYLASRYPDLKFGNLVLCQSYRNPGLLAKMMATLQVLSKGRYIAGLGTGWKEDEYLAYNYPFPPFRERFEQLSELVQILRLMWNESPATFEGRHYRVKDAYCEPLPDFPPPLLIGGGGEKFTLRLVAEQADWMNIAFPDVTTFKRKLEVLDGHCQTVGRAPESITRSLWTYVEIKPDEHSPGVDTRDRHFVSGSADQVAAELRKFQAAGAECVMIRFVDFPKTTMAERFLNEVIPQI